MSQLVKVILYKSKRANYKTQNGSDLLLAMIMTCLKTDSCFIIGNKAYDEN